MTIKPISTIVYLVLKLHVLVVNIITLYHLATSTYNSNSNILVAHWRIVETYISALLIPYLLEDLRWQLPP